MRFRIVLTLFLILPAFIQIAAQNNCDNALYEADKLYESGKFAECIQNLEPCLNSKSGKEFKAKAYRLISLSSLNLSNDEKAREYAVKLLKTQPDYLKYPGIDPLGFSRMINEYRVLPKIFAGIKFGFNINSIALKQSYSAYESAQSYDPSAGYQVGMQLQYNLNSNYYVFADLMYSGIGITHHIENAGGWKQKYTEQEDFINLNPGFARNFKLSNKISAHAGMGLGIGLMHSAYVYLESVNSQTESLQQASKDAIKERNKIQPSAQALGGMSFGVSGGTLSVDAGFAYCFSSTVNPSKRMDDLNFIFNNQYINDDISHRLFSLNLSYNLPIKWEVSKK